MTGIEKIVGDPGPFFEQLDRQIASLPISFEKYECDHICFRTSSVDEYQKRVTALTQEALLLTQAEVGGRPIATFFLREPLVWNRRKIELLEVPAPKPGKPTALGFEHVEWVVGLNPSFLLREYPGLVWSTSGLQKSANPELELKLSGGIAMKFHAESLLTVIQKERLAEIASRLLAVLGDWAAPLLENSRALAALFDIQEAEFRSFIQASSDSELICRAEKAIRKFAG